MWRLTFFCIFDAPPAWPRPKAFKLVGNPLSAPDVLPACRYENEASLFAEDYSQWSSRERMKAWDKRWSYLKSLPQVSECYTITLNNKNGVWGLWVVGAGRHDSLEQALVVLESLPLVGGQRHEAVMGG